MGWDSQQKLRRTLARSGDVPEQTLTGSRSKVSGRAGRGQDLHASALQIHESSYRGNHLAVPVSRAKLARVRGEFYCARSSLSLEGAAGVQEGGACNGCLCIESPLR